MYIEIDTYDRRLDFDLFEIPEKTTLSVGDQKSLPGGFTMINDGLIGRKAFGFPETINLVITFAEGAVSTVAITLLGTWLYDKLKNRAEKLRIDGKEVHIEKEEITRIIEDTIRRMHRKIINEITVLFLAANPTTDKLMLDEEIRAIDEKVYASEYRDYLKIESYWAIRPDDLLQSLNRYKPHIVHFSGHGSEAGELILVDSNRSPKTVDTRTIKALFAALKDNIQVVILNACYSRFQAEAITEIISCAIGMNDAIGDEAAIIFAASFYRAIGFGRSVQDAFNQGKVALLLEGIPEENTPELLVKAGVNPSQIVLVSRTASPPEPTSPIELSGKEKKRERLFNAYKVILNAAEEYEAVLHQLGYVVEGETKETRDRRLNASLQKALEGVNDAMIILTLENVGTDVKTIFDAIRQAFNSYVNSLGYNAQYPNSFSFNDLTKDKQAVISKVAELKKAMQVHLKELES